MSAVRRIAKAFRGLAQALILVAAWNSPVKAEPQSAPLGSNDCVARLAERGIETTPATIPPAVASPLCAIELPVRLLSVADATAPERRIRFPGKPVLSCAMAERLGTFASDIVAPFALGIYGKELVSITTGSGYECRPRNRQAGAKISSHGQGNAIDIIAMEVIGGRKVSVEKPDGAETMRFMAGVRAAACGVFSTVLGPGSDASHGNHLHLDIEKRGYNGLSKLCQ